MEDDIGISVLAFLGWQKRTSTNPKAKPQSLQVFYHQTKGHLVMACGANSIREVTSLSRYRALGIGFLIMAGGIACTLQGDVHAAPAGYRIVDLGHWNRRVSTNSGTVAGQKDGVACMASGGTMTSFGGLEPNGLEDAVTSTANAINTKGDIVGSSGSHGPVVMSGLEQVHPFLLCCGGR